MFDDIPRPTCRSVYTVSDKHLRHGGSGYETTILTEAVLKKKISTVPNDDILHAIYGIFIGRPQQFIQFSYPIAFGNSC